MTIVQSPRQTAHAMGRHAPSTPCERVFPPLDGAYIGAQEC